MLKSSFILEKLLSIDNKMINEDVFNAVYGDIPDKLKELLSKVSITKESVDKVGISGSRVVIVSTKTIFTAPQIKILLKKLSIINVNIDNDGKPALMLILKK